MHPYYICPYDISFTFYVSVQFLHYMFKHNSNNNNYNNDDKISKDDVSQSNNNDDDDTMRTIITIILTKQWRCHLCRWTRLKRKRERVKMKNCTSSFTFVNCVGPCVYFF